MSPVFGGVSLVALSTIFDSFSQIAMKKATPRNRATAPWIAVAVLCSCIEAVLYTFALKVLAVGIAFAISGLSFATVTVLARILLKEHVTMTRWIGVALIATGASMVAAYA
jgi:drug/metabolite transporter (DMT)-like permease